MRSEALQSSRAEYIYISLKSNTLALIDRRAQEPHLYKLFLHIKSRIHQPSKMSFTLHSLVAVDVPTCVSIYFSAFQNPHSLGCWPRIDTVRSWWENMLYDELDEPGAHWLKAVSTSTGQLAAFAKWVEPKPGVFPDTSLAQWPEGADQALCDETFGAWARRRRELMGDRGHWCKTVKLSSW